MRISVNGTLQLEPAKIAGIYAVLGTVWIVFSDRWLSHVLGHDALRMTVAQSWKGAFFVASTTVFLYIILSIFDNF